MFLIVLHTLTNFLPFIGTALLGWALLKSDTTERLVADGGASGGRGLARRTTAAVARTASGARRRTRQGAAAAGAARERELLEAIGRRGEITAAGAALETSLSVGEADRMLSGLAAKGHLAVRVEGGAMLYSMWEQGG